MPHEVEALSSIRAAPPATTAAFDLAESLSTQALPNGPWRHAFRQLLTDEAFLAHGWAKAPFKLAEEWPFAVGSYTMEDVARDATLMPPQFLAHGVEYQGGIYNKPFAEGFGFADVEAAMDGATVVMLNAGFLVPKLAAVSLAMLEASQLPIWLNVYLSKAGLVRSTQLHTDKQDVLLVQSTGRKRWRVYKPPPPADAPQLDPFARGKGTDALRADPADLLIDTVMAPGQVLYIPAGFPHETDTIGEVSEPSALAAASEPSVHLTVGIDTHLWGLSYSRMREVALDRAGMSRGKQLTLRPADSWSLLHQPLPLGFLAAPMLTSLCDAGRSATIPLHTAQHTLCQAMALELAKRLRAVEPERWGAAEEEGAADSLIRELGLDEAAERLVDHHRRLLGRQRSMYTDAAAPQPTTADGLQYTLGGRERKLRVSGLMSEMDALDAAMEGLEAWSRGEEADGGGGATGFGGGGMGGGGLGGGGKGKGAKGKAKGKGKRK